MRAAPAFGIVLLTSTFWGFAAQSAAAAQTPPGAPTDVTAVAGNSSARVSWTPPADTGSSPITYYQVDAAPTTSRRPFEPGSVTSATAKTLVNGVTYTFTVTAISRAGAGPPSEPSAPVTPQDICTLVGTAGDDVIVGTPGDDAICGLGGDDTFFGNGGGDTFIGGAGKDTVDYSDTGSPLEGIWFYFICCSLGTPPFDAFVDDQTPFGDTLREFEVVRGSPYGDLFLGNELDNTFVGGGGSDLIIGEEGNDVLRGDEGDDTIEGGPGGDKLYGGPGNDDLAPLGGNDKTYGGIGQDTVSFLHSVEADLTAGTSTGDGGQFIELLDSVENLVGSRDADELRGSTFANVLTGGPGNDTIDGAGGRDDLSGEDGADALIGGRGVDVCRGGAGTDTATTCETVTSVP